MKNLYVKIARIIELWKSALFCCNEILLILLLNCFNDTRSKQTLDWKLSVEGRDVPFWKIFRRTEGNFLYPVLLPLHWSLQWNQVAAAGAVERNCFASEVTRNETRWWNTLCIVRPYLQFSIPMHLIRHRIYSRFRGIACSKNFYRRFLRDTRRSVRGVLGNWTYNSFLSSAACAKKRFLIYHSIGF